MTTDTDTIIRSLAEFEVHVKTLQAETQAKMKMIMSEMFQTFFSAFPQVKTVHWNQYTPYFNDGDECVFSVNSIEFNANEYGGEEDESFDEGESFSVSKYNNHRNLPTDLYQACLAVENVIDNMADELKAMIGDHSSVFVTARGIDVEEYEHE